MPEDPEGTIPEKPGTLSAAEKLAVQEYLRDNFTTWLKLFGFASIGSVVAALAVSVFYIFFLLPGKAVELATANLAANIGEVSKDLNTALAKQLADSGANAHRLELLEQNLTSQEVRLEKLAGATTDDIETAVNLLDAVRGDRELKTLAQMVRPCTSEETVQQCACRYDRGDQAGVLRACVALCPNGRIQGLTIDRFELSSGASRCNGEEHSVTW